MGVASWLKQLRRVPGVNKARHLAEVAVTPYVRGDLAELRAVTERDIADLREKSSGMKVHWQQEKENISRIRDMKERMEKIRIDAERATKEGNLAKAAELQYGTIPALEKEIKDARAALSRLQSRQRMLKEEVDCSYSGE